MGAEADVVTVIGLRFLMQLIGRENRRLARIGDIPRAQWRMRISHIGAAVRALLFRRHGDAPAADRKRHLHEGMRWLGAGRIVLVTTERARTGQVRNVDDGDAGEPATGIQLVGATQCVMQ